MSKSHPFVPFGMHFELISNFYVNGKGDEMSANDGMPYTNESVFIYFSLRHTSRASLFAH